MPTILEREAVIGRLAPDRWPSWTALWGVLNDRAVLEPIVNQYGLLLLLPPSEEQGQACRKNNALLFKDTLRIESDEEEKALFVPLLNITDLNDLVRGLLAKDKIPESLFETDQIGELGFLIKRIEEGWGIDIVCHQKIHPEKAEKISLQTYEQINSETRKIVSNAINKDLFPFFEQAKVYLTEKYPEPDGCMFDTFLIFTQEVGHSSTFDYLLEDLSRKYNK